MFERTLAFPRCLSKKDSFNTDILVKFRPMDTFSITDEPPVFSLLRITMQKTWEPRQGNSDRAPVIKIYHQGILGNRNSLRG